jgi:hypothetical protein
MGVKLISHTMRRMEMESVPEQGAKENIWT